MIRIKLFAALVSIILVVGCSTPEPEQMQWKKLPLPTNDDITGIHFPDDNLGYAVTAQGTVLKTADGGATFEILDYRADTRLEDAYFLSDDEGFIFGRDGFLARTGDGGQSWERVECEPDYWIMAMNFLDDDHAYLTGQISSNGQAELSFIGTSSDEGASWSFDTTEHRGLDYIDILQEYHVWISGDNSIIYTTDRGETWERHYTGDQADDVTGVFFTEVKFGWCVGKAGLLLYTSDGGWSWERKDRLTERDLNCVTAPEFQRIYLAGDGIILGTGDHGRSWEIDSTGYQATFLDFHWNDDAVYLAGSSGTLLKLVR